MLRDSINSERLVRLTETRGEFDSRRQRDGVPITISPKKLKIMYTSSKFHLVSHPLEYGENGTDNLRQGGGA